jgi:hypothetical protein
LGFGSQVLGTLDLMSWRLQELGGWKVLEIFRTSRVLGFNWLKLQIVVALLKLLVNVKLKAFFSSCNANNSVHRYSLHIDPSFINSNNNTLVPQNLGKVPMFCLPIQSKTILILINLENPSNPSPLSFDLVKIMNFVVVELP